MMELELFGMARSAAGTPVLALDVREPVTVRDLLQAAAAASPALLGSVIAADGSLIAPNLLLLDGRREVALEDRVCAADRPCLLFLPSGG
ncbi:MAG: hypothetical protein KGM44_02755 [bacterium]|nr:hypothetical protein [bacterium]